MQCISSGMRGSGYSAFQVILEDLDAVHFKQSVSIKIFSFQSLTNDLKVIRCRRPYKRILKYDVVSLKRSESI